MNKTKSWWFFTLFCLIVLGIFSSARAKSEFENTPYFREMPSHRIVDALNQEFSHHRFNNSKIIICASAATCSDNAECKQENYYCDKAVADCGGEGYCIERPEVCIADYNPVCGCDGVTYPNACNAAMNGVPVVYLGECK